MSATGGRDPRFGPSTFARDRAAVSPTRLARPVPAGSGEIGHRRHRRLKPPTLRLEASKLERKCSGDRGAQAGRWQSGRAEVSPPSGRQERFRRSVREPSGQTGGWKRWPNSSAQREGEEQRGSARRSVPGRLHAKAGRRAALDAQPERLLPARRANKEPRSGKKEKWSARGTGKSRPPPGRRENQVANPRGKRKALLLRGPSETQMVVVEDRVGDERV